MGLRGQPGWLRTPRRDGPRVRRPPGEGPRLHQGQLQPDATYLLGSGSRLACGRLTAGGSLDTIARLGAGRHRTVRPGLGNRRALMRSRGVSAVLATVLLALGVSACGGGSSSNATGNGAPVNSSAVRKQLEQAITSSASVKPAQANKIVDCILAKMNTAGIKTN